MVHRIVAARLVAFALVGTATACQAQNDELVNRFKREYPAAAGRLADRSAGCDMRYTVEVLNGRVESYRYRSAGGRVRLDIENRNAGPTSWVFDGDRLWCVHKANDRSDYQLMGLRSPEEQEGLEFIRAKSRYAAAPYSIFEKRLVDFMDEPGFSILDAETVESEGRSLVKIRWENPHLDDEGQRKVCFGAFLFDPAHDWMLVEYEFGFDRELAAFRHAKIRYRFDSTGTPLVDGFEEVVDRNGTVTPLETVTMSSMQAVGAPADEFRLSAFAIPVDVGINRLPENRRPWLILLVNAIVLAAAVAAYLASQRLARRRCRGAES